MVQVNYRGTFISGAEFDKSDDHGGATELQVENVIPGWTEALQLMESGSKWQLFIPAELAYGEMGQGPDIGPNVTLIFEVELVSIAATRPIARPSALRPLPSGGKGTSGTK